MQTRIFSIILKVFCYTFNVRRYLLHNKILVYKTAKLTTTFNYYEIELTTLVLQISRTQVCYIVTFKRIVKLVQGLGTLEH